ncbi:AraC family transcriptional regulator [Chromohalobacter sp. 11-W]|uniref:AraC family transcriptional regulator n=1 Tax=Chromohalobacter sp. 11-W TaxID=2994061 RepID=UPI0024696971|nr:AraC family transcriptional regulator [Chromohalobacter sp. 11-W]
MYEVQPGLFLRLAQVRDRVGLISEANLWPALKLAIVWRGEARIAFGGHATTLGPGASAMALVVALDEEAPFSRHGHVGGIENTLTLTLTPQWLKRRWGVHAASQLLPFGRQQHLAQCVWTPSVHLKAWLERIGESPARPSGANQLQLEALAMAVVGEALDAINSPLARDVSPAHHDWTIRLQRLMESGEAGRLSQEALAQRMDMSLSQLQRRFHQRHGMALGQYLRRQRLEVARGALVDDRISVDNAAALAGYNSAANFATAFKRAFGVTPSMCRRMPR